PTTTPSLITPPTPTRGRPRPRQPHGGTAPHGRKRHGDDQPHHRPHPPLRGRDQDLRSRRHRAARPPRRVVLGRTGRDGGGHRPVGLRQIHPPAPRRRPRDPHRRAGHHLRAGAGRGVPGRARRPPA